MPEQRQTSVPQQGMIQDINPLNLKETQYPFAQNAAVEAREGNTLTLQNDGSNLLSVNFPAGFKVIGRLSVHEQNRTLFALVNPTTQMSEIGEVIECHYSDVSDDPLYTSHCTDCDGPYQPLATPLEQRPQIPYCTYHTIVQDACLNFSLDFPVKMEYKIKDCDFELYFTDRRNQRRFMYFDYQGANPRANLVMQDHFKVVTGYVNDDCHQPIYGTALDCNKIAYHPKFDFPCVDTQDAITGGQLKAGTYQFLPAYCDRYGNALTNHFPASNPFPIFSRFITFETNYQTDKAIHVSFKGLDQTGLFDYYKLVVAETVDNFTSFKLVGIFPVNQTIVTYSGGPDFKALAPDDVFFRQVFYKSAANVTKANDYLFFSNLAEWSKPNLQRVANKVRLYWETVAIPEAVYRDPKNVAKFRGYPRDEVQALGMVFVTDVGEELGAYHVPGPSRELFAQYAIDIDAPVNNNDSVDQDDCVDENCCGSDKTVTITSSCNCGVGGHVRFQFTMAEPFDVPVTVHLGVIEHQPMVNNNVATGYSIFTLPTGVIPWTYYNNPSRPWEVIIPAGVTSYTTGDVHFYQEVVGELPNVLTCDLCSSNHLFYITDVYAKVITPLSYTVGFLSGNTTSGDTHVSVHDVPSDTVDNSDCSDCTTPFWKVYNTAFPLSAPHEVTSHCDEDKIWEWGEFGFWESTRTYPNIPEVWGELCGKPIRHHLFPDCIVSHIHDGASGAKGFTDHNIVYPMGIRVDHQSVVTALDDMVTAGVISAADRARIRSYYIVRGNRVGHKSIIAKGLLFDMWSYPKHGHTYYYPNFPYNDLRDNRFISNDENTYEGSNTSGPTVSTFAPSGRYTFHSPDTHFNQPGLGNFLKLEVEEYGKAEGFFNHCEEEARFKLLSTAAMTLAFAAGVATAFSAIEEKECTTYTVKSSSVEIGLMGGVTTWSDLPFTRYEKNTGLPIIPVVDPGSLGAGVESYTKNTCKGTPYQLLNPLSLSVVGFLFQQAIYKGTMAMNEMQIIIDLVKALIPLKNFAIQYNSVGRYLNFTGVPNNTGNKIRQIKRAAYLEPKVQLVDEAIDTAAGQFSSVFINNWHRESSVYVKVDSSKLLPPPSKVDTSRFTMNQVSLEQEDLGKRVQSDISSYYASIKNKIPDQWGFVSDIDYLSTGRCNFFLDQTYTIPKTGVFGGDTFISRFALKRKHPFFLQSRFRQADETDVRYSDLGSAGFPNYYLNTEESLFERMSGNTFAGNIISIITDLMGVANTRLDARKNKFFYQSGFIHLYNFGIPYFLCESEVNVDMRHGENALERDFYPHQQDLDYWLQEKNVPFKEDNYYQYNKTYSRQNHETFVAPQVLEVPAECKLTYPSSAIQSEKDEYNSKADNWLVFKANNRIDFAASNGAIMGLNGIENDKVLVRFENGFKVFSAYDTIKTGLNEIQVGNGGVFNSRPLEFGKTPLGYAGAQHADLLQTEFGHIWADAKNGHVFVLASSARGLDELAKDGMKNWFKENLPFQLLKDFSAIKHEDLDNNFKGVGLHMSYDNRFSRFFITKLDYKKLRSDIQYDADAKRFYIGDHQYVELSDDTYFCNRSWTVSYSFLTKSWVSYHSFLPNFYVDTTEYIQSGLNAEVSSLWSHNVSNKSYQVYYGKLYPFAVEVSSTPLMLNGVLSSVSYMQDAIRYHKESDYAYDRTITFNKAWISNKEQSSGMLSLNVRNQNNMAQSIRYPFMESDMNQILVTRVGEVWNFNQFWDVVRNQPSNVPLFTHNCNNCDKTLNTLAMNYYKPDSLKQKIRGGQTTLRLINDIHSSYKFLFHFVTQEKASY